MQKVAAIIIMLLIISGCAALRRENLSIPESVGEAMFTATEIVKNNLTEKDFNIQRAEIQYVDSGTEIRFIANLKYRHGGLYLASLRTRTGIEAARIYITRDTIFVNDRINKRLYCGSSEYIERKYGISAEALPLIMGDVVLKSKDELKLSCLDGQTRIDTRLGESGIVYNIDCMLKKAVSVFISRENIENKIKISCSEHQFTDVRNYPRIIEIEESSGNSMLKIEISKIEFNNLEDINFIPGNNYEKVIIK